MHTAHVALWAKHVASGPRQPASSLKLGGATGKGEKKRKHRSENESRDVDFGKMRSVELELLAGYKHNAYKTWRRAAKRGGSTKPSIDAGMTKRWRKKYLSPETTDYTTATSPKWFLLGQLRPSQTSAGRRTRFLASLSSQRSTTCRILTPQSF